MEEKAKLLKTEANPVTDLKPMDGEWKMGKELDGWKLKKLKAEKLQVEGLIKLPTEQLLMKQLSTSQPVCTHFGYF